MSEGLSLRFRLNLMIVSTMLLIIGLGSVFAIHQARRSVAEEVNSSVALAMQLIEAGLVERREADESFPAWLVRVVRLDRVRHLRIVVSEAPARLIDLSAGKKSDRAGAPDWFARLVAPEPVVAERRVAGDGRPDVAIRIEADAGDEIAEAWAETQGFLGLLGVLAAAVYGLVHVTVGRAFRSVGLILKGLEDIEQGEYGRRLPEFSLPEFARVARAYNHMAESLDQARAENRALAQESLDIQEEERRYLAQELHDELGQSLTAIRLMAASLRNAGDASRPAVDHIMATCDRLFGVLRGMLRRLRPLMLDELGLSASLEDLVGNWRLRNPGVRLDFFCEEGVDDSAGPAGIHLFRIVQEALTNVARHAVASEVRVFLTLAESWIVLEVGDDGRGCDSGQPRRGFGLLGIRERIESLGGMLEIVTRPGGGFALEAWVPCGVKDDLKSGAGRHRKPPP
jgi:two-component system sensor histidine kinase UhpB